MTDQRTQTPTIALALGPVRFTGRAALVPAFAVLAAIVALVAHYRARLLSSPLTISAILWITFQIYWTVAATNSAPSVRSESTASRAVHQRLMLLSIALLFTPLPWLDRRILPSGVIWPVIGVGISVASLALAIGARRTLGRNWSGEITQKTDHQLIRSGPYRFARHPIYSALIGLCLGTAFVSGDVHAFLGTLLMTVAYIRKIRLEERNLDDVFGSAYADYRRSTRALIPWVL